MSKKQPQRRDRKTPARRIKAYTRASGKRVAAFTRKPKPGLVNSITGKPRRWTYGVQRDWPNRQHSTGAVNWILELAEIGADVYGRGRGGWGGLPDNVFDQVLKSVEEFAEGLRERKRKRYPSLTESEIRYCEMEGIALADFQTAKVASQGCVKTVMEELQERMDEEKDDDEDDGDEWKTPA